jgi:hypothetical protein
MHDPAAYSPAGALLPAEVAMSVTTALSKAGLS